MKYGHSFLCLCAGLQRPDGCVIFHRAVSSSKCNELVMMLKEVERLGHKQFGRAFPVEAGC